MSKQLVIRTGQVGVVGSEAYLHKQLLHPSICRLLGTAQDADNLYLLLELLSGGELYTLLYEEASPLTHGTGGMAEHYVRFYGACVLLALSFLHSLEPLVLYRDLKTENIILDHRGYPKLVDFGHAKRLRAKQSQQSLEHEQAQAASAGVQVPVRPEPRTFTACGTPDYNAPEMHRGNGYGAPAEYWAFGVLLFELLTGSLPFFDEDPMVSVEKIIDADIEWPRGFCTEHPVATDLILRLLEPDPQLRLGSRHGGGGASDGGLEGAGRCLGFDVIKQHAFFDGVNWDHLWLQSAEAPYTPPPFDPSTLIGNSSESDDDEQVCFDSENATYVFSDF